MNIFQPIKLLLPALIPSWNFFDEIAPSPRIQFTLLNSENKQLQNWQEFRPRPAKLSFIQILKRMVWNPRWNESLFLVSCAERIMQQYTEHSENEILTRIERDLTLYKQNIPTAATQLQFRLLFVERSHEQLLEEITFISRSYDLSQVMSE